MTTIVMYENGMGDNTVTLTTSAQKSYRPLLKVNHSAHLYCTEISHKKRRQKEKIAKMQADLLSIKVSVSENQNRIESARTLRTKLKT